MARKETAWTDRRRQVAELYLQGHYQAEIAERFGVTQQTISHDLKRIHEAWMASAVGRYDEMMARELARIDHLERAYWLAWEDSKGTIQKTRTEKGPSGDRAMVAREESSGDPRFLAGVQWCIERRIKLLGLDAPVRQRTEISGPNGGPVQTKTDVTHDFDGNAAAAIFDILEAAGAFGTLADEAAADEVHSSHANAQADGVPGAAAS